MSSLMEDKVQEEIEKQKKKKKKNEEERQLNGQAAEGRREEKKKKGVDEVAIRKKCMQGLHEIMDEAVEKRHYRFEQAVLLEDTTRLWDLVAAAFEEANIRYHN